MAIVTSFLRTAAAATVVLLFASAPALAAEPAHGDAHATEHATDGHSDGHGDAAAHGGDHGEGHGGGHHVTYTDDDDGDGIVNWRDPQFGTQEGYSDSYVIRNLVYHAINFLILMGLIWWALRRPIADVFRDRARGIRSELTDSARHRDEANQRHQELLARLDKIEGEVETMHTDAKAAAEREEAALIERAEREAVRIGEQATRSIRDEATRARNALRREAVELAVQLAEETLRSKVASEDQRSLAKDFLDSLQQGA